MPTLEHAEHWRALLVGIEHYARGERRLVSDLQRPVPDVVRAARWLLASGVPAERITVHAKNNRANSSLVKQLNQDMQTNWVDWKVKAATLSALHATLRGLQREPKSPDDRLLVILSGHGLYLPDGGRVLLTQEYNGEDALTNISLTYMQRLLAGAGYKEVSIFYAACANSAYQVGYARSIEPGWPTGASPPPEPPNPSPMFTLHASRVMEFAKEVGDKNVFLDSVLGYLESKPSSLRDFDPVRGVEALSVERLSTSVRDAVKVHGFEPRPEWNLAPERVKHLFAWSVPTTTLTVKVDPYAVRDRIDYVRVEQVRPYPQDWRIPPSAEATYVTQVQQGSTLRTDIPLKIDAIGWRPIRHGDHFEVASTPYVSSLAFDSLEPDTQAVWELSAASPDGQVVDVLSTIRESLPVDQLIQDDKSPLIAAVVRDRVFQMHFKSDRDAAFPVAEDLWRKAMEITADMHPDVTVKLENVDANPLSALKVWPPRHGWATLLGEAWMASDSSAQAWQQPLLYDRRVLTVLRSGDLEFVTAMTGRELHERRRSSHAIRLPVDPGVYEVQIALPWGGWSQTVSVSPGELTTVRLPERVGDPPLRYRLIQGVDDGQGGTWIHWLGHFHLSRRLRGRPDEGLDVTCWVDQGLTGPQESERLRPETAKERTPVNLDRSRPTPIALNSDTGEATLQIGHRQYCFPMVKGRGILVARNGFRGTIRVEPYSYLYDAGWDSLVTLGHLEDPAALTPDVLRTLLYAKGADGLLGLAGGYALQLGSHGSHQDRLLVTTNLLTVQPGIDAELLYLAARLSGVEERPGPPLFPTRFPTATGVGWDRQNELLERMRQGETPLFRWGVDLALVLASRPELHELVPTPWERRLRAISRLLIRDNVWTLWRREDLLLGREARPQKRLLSRPKAPPYW
ncbi:caspase family protein [Deinococcus soli (ex Cha et al. 2016)]|uniref:caspase family protein n=1 Tax=Deinococcus soli (ex Cha et al. 2016) TaxID=1309411 RepID=UPI00166D471D|nr:caspase family protein [Deinococcus soli (ex Cha et al. 2016)]GGB84688.1 hypothetical protein GCM10008019_45840 [Deinococcus soli (ex Cha et al. 2016)]